MVPLGGVQPTPAGHTPLAVNHQGQFVATTITFNLQPGVSCKRRDGRRSTRRWRGSACPPRSTATSRRGARRSSNRSASEPMLILAALARHLHRARHALREHVHPMTILSTLPSAGVGAVLALMLFKHRVQIIALIGVILLIGIVKKNAIMMIDVALDAERREGLTPARGDPRGLPAALPPDHDDDAGGDAGRPAAGHRRRRGRGAAPAARHRDRRRTGGEPGPHPLHDAGGLSLPGALAPAGAERPPAGSPRSRPNEDTVCIRAGVALALGLLAGCKVGPNYSGRRAARAGAFKELAGWKPAEPRTRSTAAPGGRSTATRCWTGWSGRSRSRTRP